MTLSLASQFKKAVYEYRIWIAAADVVMMMMMMVQQQQQSNKKARPKREAATSTALGSHFHHQRPPPGREKSSSASASDSVEPHSSSFSFSTWSDMKGCQGKVPSYDRYVRTYLLLGGKGRGGHSFLFSSVERAIGDRVVAAVLLRLCLRECWYSFL